MLNKDNLIAMIIEKLSADLELFAGAARNAHEAATHEENQPDNKYDTLALEASYVAQGQANRAQDLRCSLEAYRNMPLVPCTGVVRLSSLVTIEGEDGTRRTVFIGPVEGGMKISCKGEEIMVITPLSPLGTELVGQCHGDVVELKVGPNKTEYEIVEVA